MNATDEAISRAAHKLVIRHSLVDGMPVNDAGRIAWLAVLWYTADTTRKLRRREAKRAWMLAFKAGVVQLTVQHCIDDVRIELHAPTPEAEAALARARAARETYLVAARSAGALRGQLTRKLRPWMETPIEDPEIAREYAALCAREEDAAKVADGILLHGGDAR